MGESFSEDDGAAEWWPLRVLLLLLFFFVFLPFLGPLPTAHGSSQVRGLIGAVATSLCHSHSNSGI